MNPLRAWFRDFAAAPRHVVLAAFLFAGDLKNGALLSRLPVDLTVLTAALLSGVLLVRWWAGARAHSGLGLALMALWFLSFLPGALAARDSAYAVQKVATIYSFSLLAALAPFVLVRGPRDLPGLLNALAWFGLAITVDSLGNVEQGLQRLQGAGGGTISLGRAAGFLFLAGALRLAGPGPLPVLSLALAGLGAVAAVFSGSRGPMSGAALGLVLALVLGRRGPAPAWRRLALGGAVLAAVLGLSLAAAPRGSLARTQSFLQGDLGTSERYRALAVRTSWARVPGAPLGLGWGGFAAEVDLENGAPRQYPHNLLVETALEGGWACALATVAVLLAGLGRAWGWSLLPAGRLLFAGLVFYGVNALVSGDLNDNRPLFCLLGTALALGRGPAREVPA